MVRALPWTWTTEGKQFHAYSKNEIMKYIFGYIDFIQLGKLIAKKAWRTDHGEMSPNIQKLANIREDFFKSDVYKSKKIDVKTRLVVRAVIDYIIALLNSDEMYYERGIWIVNRVIERGERWKNGTLEIRIEIMKELQDLYFQAEKRDDRFIHMKNLWARGIVEYETNVPLRIVIDWWVIQLYESRAVWDVKERSKLGLEVDDPTNWYPVGRGKVWHLVHGGKG